MQAIEFVSLGFPGEKFLGPEVSHITGEFFTS